MLYRNLLLAGLAPLALALSAGMAQAQDAAAVEAPAEAAAPAVPEPLVVKSSVDTVCELHVFPAERFSSMSSGLLGGGLIDAAIHADKDKSNRTQMASALDPVGQIDALRSMDLIELLKLPPTNITFHYESLPRKTVGKTKTRRAASQSTCYSELILLDVMYQKAMIYGRSLRTLIWFRDFGSSQDKSVNYRGMGGNGLKLFPAKEGEDIQAANDELNNVFKLNFTEFAASAVRSRKPAAK